MPGRLWKLLSDADARRCFLFDTDHLSDRELYAELWQHSLREPARWPRGWEAA